MVGTNEQRPVGLQEASAITRKTENPPVKDNGRRKGYRDPMKELWDQMGNEDLGLMKQNLRDQAARLEKSFGSVTSAITNGIKAKRGGDNAEGVLNSGRQIAINDDQEEPNLHTTLTQYQQRDNGDLFPEPDLHTTLTQHQERCSLLEPANRITETISPPPLLETIPNVTWTPGQKKHHQQKTWKKSTKRLSY